MLWAFQSGDLYYTITSNVAPYTVEVTGGNIDYSGDITIPSSVTYNGITYAVAGISSRAFEDCSSLTSVTIPNSVTSIGSWAFDGCSSLTSVTIPESVTNIEHSAFEYCRSLSSVILFDGLTNIGNSAFRYCSLKSIDIPSTVTTIGQHAFEMCDFTSVVIPSSVTKIEYWAFSYCPIETITVEEGNPVYDSRSNCNAIIETATNTLVHGIKNTVIPSSIRSIENYAFYGCYVDSIIIPNGVESISYGAFAECTSLESITIPMSVSYVGEFAFQNCRLKKIYIKNPYPPYLGGILSDGLFSPVCYVPCGTLEDYDDSDWYSQVKRFVEEPCEEYTITYTSTDGNIVIPNKADAFGANIVSNTYENGVGTITFDSPVTSIGSQAFKYCSSLTSVTIPTSVTSIGSGAFYNCSSLTSVTIPSSVTSIESYAFMFCSDLTSVTIPNSVTSIGSDAFYNCSSLTSVTIPNSVTSIGSSAFGYCSSLTSITIPSSVTSIGGSAFDGCSSLTSITIPSSVTSIEGAAFQGCSSLTSVTIPNSVTSIGRQAFCDCAALTSVTIPSSVTSIGGSAFNGCSSLTSVTIPNSVTSIGDWAFYNCSSLTSITIPSSVRSIGNTAFRGCSSLTSVSIPNSVTSIGNSAFEGCSSLNTIYVEATTPPELGTGTFAGTPSPLCYIPCGTKAAYEASDWAQYVSEFVEECDNGSYSRNVRIGYNTICLPHGSSNFTGATFYEIAHILKNKKKIFFDEVKTLEAGKPYIFYPHSTEVTVYYDNTTSAVPLSHNGLHGTFDGITAASNFLKGKYLVAGDRMVLCGDGCSLATNRAYIVLDEISDKDHPAIPGIKRVSMDYSEENATTALDNITDETIVAPIQEGVYDILGRKVDAPTVSGFYIINGKKVFVAL